MIYVIGKSIGAYGGGAIVAMDIVDSLYQSGLNVGTVSVGQNVTGEYSDNFLKIPHVQMPYLPAKKSYNNDLYNFLRFELKRVEYCFRWLNMRFQFLLNRPEIMMFNDTFHATRDILEAHQERSKLVQIVHVSPAFVEDFFGDYTLEKCLADYNKADVVLFVSDKCRKKWLEYGVLDQEKAYYIPNCAKEDEAGKYLNQSKAEARKKLGLNPDSFYLVNVSSLKERKGQDLLIKAAPELKKIAPNLEILIVGPGSGEYVSELKETVNQKNLEFVRFTGSKLNAMEYIYASDLFVLPSRAEAFPLVILEAMILKTPVIASNVDGVPEMITHEETGCLFESENIGGLVQMFEIMYRNREIREEYAENASAKYWSDFSKEQFTKRYVRLIDNMVKDNR